MKSIENRLGDRSVAQVADGRRGFLEISRRYGGDWAEHKDIVYSPDEEVKEKQSAGSFFQSHEIHFPLWTTPLREVSGGFVVVQISPSGTAIRETGLSLKLVPPTIFTL